MQAALPLIDQGKKLSAAKELEKGHINELDDSEDGHGG